MLSVVIPMRDEAANVAGVVSEVHAALSEIDFELVCVDDGSVDDTGTLLVALAANDERLVVVTHARSLGQSFALRSGVMASRGQLIATLDGDAQNDPADIPSLLREKERTGATMIAGDRRRRQDPWSKRVSSSLGNSAYRWLLGDDTPDTGCGLKLFDRDAFTALPYFDHMHRYLPALMKRQGAVVVSVEVRHRARAAGHSKYGIVDRLVVGLTDILGVRWLLRRYPSRSVEAARAPIRATTVERSKGS